MANVEVAHSGRSQTLGASSRGSVRMLECLKKSNSPIPSSQSYVVSSPTLLQISVNHVFFVFEIRGMGGIHVFAGVVSPIGRRTSPN